MMKSASPRVDVLPIEQGATPDLNNVNKHTQRGGKLLGNSLRKRGAFRSIASAGKGVEVPVVGAGNFTLENAVDAGFTEIVNVHVSGNQLVNVVRDDIAPGSPEFYALAIEDNEIGKQSYSPDVDILASLAAGDSAILSALRQEDKIFDSIVGDMGLKEESQDADPQIDRAAELLEKWKVKTGDLWQIGQHRLICGDCTDAAVVARVMDERASICFTSPPYNAGVSAQLSGNTSIDDNLYKDEYDDDKTRADYLDLLRTFTDVALLNCDYVFVNIQVLAGNKTAFIQYWHNYMDVFCDVAIWRKRQAAPAAAKRVMDSIFEFVIVLGGNGSRAIGTRDFRGMVRNVFEGDAQHDNQFSDMHAATMPLYLPNHFIKTFTNEGELIYEPFTGTGTTIIACENLHRRGRGIEISPAYVSVTLERMATAFPGIEIKRIQS
jgi:site-specific DNA-methyltransferase (adenine-specific)